jgi:hypothetical protein
VTEVAFAGPGPAIGPFDTHQLAARLTARREPAFVAVRPPSDQPA